jgi:hypothetical protein
MTNPYIKYFKANFTGIFHSIERNALPFHQFNDIEWVQLKFTDIEIVDFYNAWELNTSNSWYRKKIKPYKNVFQSRQWVNRWPRVFTKSDFPWIKSVKLQFPVLRKRTHLIIPLSPQFQLQESIQEVVLKQFEFIEKGKEWEGGYREMKGVVYFQIHLIPKVEKTILPITNPTVEVNPIIDVASQASQNNVTNIWSINQKIDDTSSFSPNQQPLTMSAGGNRKWRIFMLLWLLFALWKFPTLFIPSLLVFGGISFYRYFRKACLGLFASLLVFCLIGFFISKGLPKSDNDTRSTSKKDGTIKILPPRETSENDLITDKVIDWWDFSKNFFHLKYNTSSTSFFDSQQYHEYVIKSISSNSSVAFYNELYQKLESKDSKKLDSIVNLFKQRIISKRLSPIKSAEMVTTFIQEIPYFLVHDLDCRTVVESSNSDFMIQYHQENKPCLPNIPGGVQSPYEFAHNLKGDCDTRSLLAFTILKRLRIPCSVWVSEAYGHSVVGIGLPIGAGTYKEINGIKHYATELTAKGYRLGMISPEQQNISNWDITLIYNR